eukprot:33623-Pyramimonas_sp.AAC.1
MFFIILASCIGAALAVVYYVHTNTRPLAEIAGKAFPEVVFSVSTREKLVALTIDDGPHPAVTPGLLETLAHFDVKATFFIIGSHAMRWPQLLDDITKQDAAGACGRLGLSGGRMDATGARAGQPPDGRRGRLQADHRAVRGPASSSRPTPSAPLVRTPNIAKEQVQPALAGGQSVGDPTLSGLSPWGIRGNKR